MFQRTLPATAPEFEASDWLIEALTPEIGEDQARALAERIAARAEAGQDAGLDLYLPMMFTDD